MTRSGHSDGRRLLRRFRRKDRSAVSNVIKFLLFGFNILFWLVGCALIAIGIWAVVQKSNLNNLSMLTSSSFDPVSLLIASGCVIFFVGFFGCVGALRENIILLAIYITCLVIVLLLLIAAAIIAFAFKDWLKNQIIVSSLANVITNYRDDLDLKNLIDWVQSEWLLCCGLKSPNDWEGNIYFNCSSPGVDSCGVPYSCCKPDLSTPIKNLQCGNGARRNNPYNSMLYYSMGCIESGDVWFNAYIIPIAGSIVAVAVLQILGICFAWNLIGDIKAQKAKWKRSA